MQQVLPIMAVQGLIVATLALAAAWLSRRLHFPGWCGALIVGLALGVMMHGQWGAKFAAVDPIFTGGQTEQQALDQLKAQQAADRQNLADTGVTPVAVEELDEQHQRELQPLIDAHDATVANHHDATRWLTLLGAAALLLIAGNPRPRRMGDALPVALGAGLFVSAAAFGATWLLLRDQVLPDTWALLTAGCFAAALPISGRYLAPSQGEGRGEGETREHDDASALLQSVAWWLLTFALAIAAAYRPIFGISPWLIAFFIALTLVGRSCDALLGRFASHQPAWRLIVALALAAAWLKLSHGGLLPGAWIAGQVLVHPNIDLKALLRLLGPVVALLIGMTVSAIGDFSLWLLIAALFGMCDIKALGVWITTRLLGGRREGLRNGCILAIAGPATLVVAWLLHDTQAISGATYNALVLAALVSGLSGEWLLRWVDRLQTPVNQG